MGTNYLFSKRNLKGKPKHKKDNFGIYIYQYYKKSFYNNKKRLHNNLNNIYRYYNYYNINIKWSLHLKKSNLRIILYYNKIFINFLISTKYKYH